MPRDDSAASPVRFPDWDLDPQFRATVDGTEEAVLNALWSAERTEGREGRVAERLLHDAVLGLLERHGRIGSQ
jgi:D-aminopeptidase